MEKAKLGQEMIQLRFQAEGEWRVKMGLDAAPPASKGPDDPNVKRAARGDAPPK